MQARQATLWARLRARLPRPWVRLANDLGKHLGRAGKADCCASQLLLAGVNEKAQALRRVGQSIGRPQAPDVPLPG